MKRLLIILGLIFFSTLDTANAISIVNQPSVLIVNGISVNKPDISTIQYSGSDGRTSIYMKNGAVLTFYTTYDEYTQINQAFVQVINTVSQVKTVPVYYNYYSDPDPYYYNTYASYIVMPRVNHRICRINHPIPIKNPPPLTVHNSYPRFNQNSHITYNSNYKTGYNNPQRPHGSTTINSNNMRIPGCHNSNGNGRGRGI